MKTIIVDDMDYLKAKKLLAESGIVIKPETETPIPLLRKSNAKPGETPAAFGGI